MMAAIDNIFKSVASSGGILPVLAFLQIMQVITLLFMLQDLWQRSGPVA
jgi:hypothetical protein